MRSKTEAIIITSMNLGEAARLVTPLPMQCQLLPDANAGRHIWNIQPSRAIQVFQEV
jgi:hypothetical protein